VALTALVASFRRRENRPFAPRSRCALDLPHRKMKVTGLRPGIAREGSVKLASVPHSVAEFEVSLRGIASRERELDMRTAVLNARRLNIAEW